MTIYHSKEYSCEEKFDYFGRKLYKGDMFIVFYDKNDLIHVDNIYEYLDEVYKDFEVQMIDEDREVYEYIKNKYDSDVYKK